MISTISKILLTVFLIFGCGKKHDYLRPGSTATIAVHFKDLNGVSKSIACSYSVPAQYTPAQKWPLIVALHGYGGHAAEFHDLWKTITDSLGFVLVTPQGENQTKEGFGWAWGSNAEQSLQICIDIVRKAAHIDPARIYIAGFSAGGALSYAMALKYPRIFKGIAALGAPFEKNFVTENTKQLQALGAFQNLRVYIGHGTLESNFVSDAQLAANTFQGLGAFVKFVPYEGIGHTLPEPMENEFEKILEFFDSKD